MRITAAESVKHGQAKLRKPRPPAPTPRSFDKLEFKERLRNKLASSPLPLRVKYESPRSIQLRKTGTTGWQKSSIPRSTAGFSKHDKNPDRTKGPKDQELELEPLPTINKGALIDDKLNKTSRDNYQGFVELNEPRAERDGGQRDGYEKLSPSLQYQRADTEGIPCTTGQSRKEHLSPSSSQLTFPEADPGRIVQALPAQITVGYRLKDDRVCLPSQSRERLQSLPPTRPPEQPLAKSPTLTLQLAPDTTESETSPTAAIHSAYKPSAVELDGIRHTYSISRTESIARGELIAEESEKYVLYTPPHEPLSVGAILRAATRDPAKADNLTIIGNCVREKVPQQAERSTKIQGYQGALSSQSSVELMSSSEASEASKTTEYSYPLPKGFHCNTDFHAALKAIQYRKWPDQLRQPPT
ncbi:hypothetical protein M433DRAFT_4620 [Acidomyces richmondensis BFW]|nr:hypothetical protein M433DRAFT_4620 [Acidomyces richmondensis BFW]